MLHLRAIARCALSITLVAGSLDAMTEDQSKVLFPALQAAATTLPQVQVMDPAKPAYASVELNRNPTIGAGARIDAVRLRVPPAGGDLVWSFAIPRACSSWYIIPAQGAGKGFENFFSGKHYRNAPWPSGPGYQSFLQTLPAERLEPGKDYLLWFEFTDETPAEIHAMVSFRPAPTGGWTVETIEQALSLEASDLDRRVACFGTRGSRFLTDPQLVDQPFGEMRMMSLLHLLDDHPIAIATGSDRALPSIAAVNGAIGAPDLVLMHDPLIAAGMTSLGAGMEAPGTSIPLQAGHRTALYDHAALTAVDERTPAIALSVLTWDSRLAAATRGGNAMDRLPGGDWTLLHQDGRLCAILRDLGGPGATLAHGAVAAGSWQGRHAGGWVQEELVVDANGDGMRTGYAHPGLVSQVFALKAWQQDGEARAYHAPGRLQAVVRYRAGLLDGEAIWYDPDGTETGRAHYRAGKRQAQPVAP